MKRPRLESTAAPSRRVTITQRNNLRPGLNLFGWAGAIWGLGGVIVMLSYAVIRLSAIALEALAMPLDWHHWLLLIGNTLFMAYSEGYRGFQKGFSPKVVGRARNLLNSPRPLPVMLAPLYCMHYFDSTRRQLITTWFLTAMIIVLIIIFHLLPQPWRGILDVGVVVGLSWGIASIVIYSPGIMNTDI